MKLQVSFTPRFSCQAIITINADLWTTVAGHNQDIAATITGGAFGTNKVVAWKESGSVAGAFSPNAAYLETVQTLALSTTYTIKVLQANDGNTWQDIDAANLALTLAPGTSCLAIISGNVDLWSTQAGYNQDIGLYVQEANATQYPAGIVAWKESVGFAGTFSPNAAAVQAVFPVTGGTTYHVKLRWKSHNMAANETVVAGAGDWPTGSGKFSPTRLTARLVSCA
jgi:hypothetical protein